MTKTGKQISLTIQGMHCASCVSSIEKAVKKIEKVNDIQINLLSRHALVDIAPELDPKIVLNAISAAGYAALIDDQSAIESLSDLALSQQEARVLFSAKNVRCAACAGHIEKALYAIDGVMQVAIDIP